MGDTTRRRRGVAEPPAPTPRPTTLGPTGGALVRRGAVRADDPQERHRFVGRVLDLLLHAETGIIRRSDADAVAEAVRSVHAVKAMASFLGLPVVVAEADGIDGRLELLRSAAAPLGAVDRAWLLAAIDRLRLLAVDPYRGPSAGSDALVPVSVAAIERLTAVAGDLTARIVGSGDPRLVALAMELHEAARSLALMPVAPLCRRLATIASDAGARTGTTPTLGVRGDDLAIERAVHEALATVLPPLVEDAVCARGATAPLLAFVQVAGSLVVRLSHDADTPEGVVDGVRPRIEQAGGTIEAERGAGAGTLIILRLPVVGSSDRM